ncbi:hypothetical protein IVG45_17255 [Methylomonas sp. LL1]|uniref:hypothetical protein n=1 Tax=Methylomonas sp. LL1 TaxID=2785785 RepID=UPI0018C3F69A|nr:hypothetical protein [Methylomonas sp. LL1]QPK62580.1 hypothetical protein IVG45_17255 [Methylomonas sp. LL1]
MKRKQNLNVAMKKIFKLSATFAAVSALAIALYSQSEQSSAGYSETADMASSVGHGDVDTLKAALDVWRENYEAKGGSPEILKVSLGYSKVLSADFTQARGQMELNLKSGSLELKTKGLDNGNYSLWLVDNRNGSVLPEASDNMMQLGDFVVANGSGQLTTQLQRQQLMGFTLDSVVVTKQGVSPSQGLSIVGSPDLMHKLYYADKPWLTTAMGDFKGRAVESTTGFEFLLPKAANADTLSDLTPVLGAQIAQGRQIFHNETFAGNGRTCGTCHRADNNFTIDPNYIMKLPNNDPLFIAETNPALADLENPTLLRKHGLILTNVDGPSVDIFRSVPHTLSMATTAKSERFENPEPNYPKGEFAADDAFANATGWSGDGAPGGGSLNEFALGAVAQHMPKTMNRIANVDFRVPTVPELDAIEAYTLSLGRSKDYPVYKITFNDPLTEAGKLLFDTKQNPCSDGSAQGGAIPQQCLNGSSVVTGASANCNGCHQNAGGRSSTTNSNPTRNTGVEQMKIHPARLLKPDMAYDGGLGQTPATCGPDGEPCFGDGRFSTAPLIEAADTAPFFHNNAVSTLEEAIASYNSDAFNTSPTSLTSKGANRQVKLDSTQVVAVASFLRAINAVENIRLSDRLDGQAKLVSNNATARELVRLAAEENLDAIQVLKEGVLGNNWQAVQKLEEAAYQQKLAQLAPIQALRNALLNNAMSKKQQARALIASCNNAAVAPSTATQPPAAIFEDHVYSCAEIGM